MLISNQIFVKYLHLVESSQQCLNITFGQICETLIFNNQQRLSCKIYTIQSVKIWNVCCKPTANTQLYSDQHIIPRFLSKYIKIFQNTQIFHHLMIDSWRTNINGSWISWVLWIEMFTVRHKLGDKIWP